MPAPRRSAARAICRPGRSSWPRRTPSSHDRYGRPAAPLPALAERPQWPAAVDQPAGPERPGELDCRGEVVLVAVGAAQLQLAQPGRREVGFSSPGMPTSTTRPRGRVTAIACSSDAPEPTQSSTRSKPPSSSSRRLWPTSRRAPVMRAPSMCSCRARRFVGAEAPRRAPCPRAWPRTGSWRSAAPRAGRRASAARSSRRRSRRRSRRAGLGDRRGVQRAGQRLDEHGVLVGQVVGHGMQLRSCATRPSLQPPPESRQ